MNVHMNAQMNDELVGTTCTSSGRSHVKLHVYTHDMNVQVRYTRYCTLVIGKP